MKNIALFVLFLFSFALLQAGVIEKSYSFKDPIISENAEYQFFGFNKLLLTGKAGEPVLPYQEVKLVLPPGEIAISIEFEGLNEVMIPGYFQLYPQQASRPLSDPGNGEFLKSAIVYNTNTAYPYSPTGELTTSYLNGYAIA